MYSKPSVLPAWAETAASPADVVQPTNSELQAGWPNTGVPPSRQRFNWALNFCANAVRYFCQRGMADYDAAETYAVNARVIGNDGNTYVSLTDNNANHQPSSSPTYWRRWGYTLDQINSSTLTQATPATEDNSTRVATTAFVKNALGVLLAYATQAWVTAQGYATQAWVNAQGFVTQAWVNAQGFATQAYVLGLGYASQAWVASQLVSGFQSNFATNGYIKLPSWMGGLIIQWARGYWSSSDQTVSWPIAFPNNCFIAQATCYWGYSSDNTTSAFPITGVSTTGVSVHPNRRTDSSPSGGTPFVIGIGN